MLIVGLGNYGVKYSSTRHNAGFMFTDFLSNILSGEKIVQNKFHGRILIIHPQQIQPECLYLLPILTKMQQLILFQPHTYMNNSGKAVQAVAVFYKYFAKEVIVVHDDVDLELGRVKVKLGGGSGGHNGLKSIDAAIGSQYVRLRIGVGHPGMKEMVSEHVLGDFKNEESAILDKVFLSITKNLALLLAGDWPQFMNKYTDDMVK
jgi:peptidyl-tRNA hydrolase, PTH1 family